MLPSLRFAPRKQTESRVLGNIGAPVDYDQWNGYLECHPSQDCGSMSAERPANLEHWLADSQDLGQLAREITVGELREVSLTRDISIWS